MALKTTSLSTVVYPCTMLHWWCTVHDPVHNAKLFVYNGSCSIVNRVHNGIFVVHNRRAPLYTGCTMLYWWYTVVVREVHNATLVVLNGRWCTMVVHHCLGGSTLT